MCKPERELNQIWSQRDKPDDLIGISSKIGALRQAVDRSFKTNGRVLIEGRQGWKKESLACLIHEKSARETKPFLCFKLC
ncbi:MAG: sigma 54-interacting transcriptional regulator [Holosporaceae bacterium]|nr:MAG: sigma 54-interacting transcriptional regulator [Holosporaceae bacterium]